MQKKVLAVVLAMSLSLALAGCNNDGQESADDKETMKETVQEEEAQTQAEETGDTKATQEAENEEDTQEESILGINQIQNGDFSNGVGKWNTYFNGGTAVLNVNEEQQLAVNVIDTGSLDYSVQTYYDGFKLETGCVYKFSFDIASSVPRTVVWRIQINGGDYHPYEIDTFQATEEMQHKEYTFTMEEGTDPAPRLCFNLGYYDDNPADLGEHIVTIDNVDLTMTDDSNKVVADDSVVKPAVNINQVGYQPNDIKKAVFRGDSVGTDFEVIDVSTGKSVFTGKISGEGKNKASQENTGEGDFTSVTAPGTYKIVNENCGESFEFQIADGIYDDLLKSAVKMLYLQRCGMELTSEEAGEFAHEACHTEAALIYGTNETKDVTGGWHDAGDYGRYVVSGAKAAADLLLAYEDYQTPEALEEARYELEWMLKMQDEASGGVYHKVTCANFPETVMPQEETEQLILSPISNCATGDFAAVMAMATRLYKDSDPAFADTCLKAAKRAYTYVQENQDADGFTNPEDIVTGEYPDDSCMDELFWAAAELYKTTGENSYHDAIKEFKIMGVPGGLGWDKVAFYGTYTYLTCSNTDAEVVAQMEKKLDYAVDKIVQNIDEDAYDSSLGDTYPWGSNMMAANNGMLLLMKAKLADQMGDSKAGEYRELAQTQLSYLLGTNATSYCFVTGFGTLSPQNTHHRPSQVVGKSMPGMLVGGPDSNLEDPFAKATLSGTAKAKCYADNAQSYSCNEVTVYWNSPLIYLISGLQENKGE